MSEKINGETFDHALDRLQDIVAQLDHDDVPIDEGYWLCCEGRTLVKYCQSVLREAGEMLKDYGKQSY